MQRELLGWREHLLGLGVTTEIQTPTQIRWSRANDAFSFPHQLAQTLLSEGGLSQSGQKQQHTLLIDSAEIWELYLLQALRRLIPGGYRVEWPRDHAMDFLLHWEGKNIRGLIPDILIVDTKTGDVVAIIDAKYRQWQLTSLAEISEQMAFYAMRIFEKQSNSHTPKLVLLYPRCAQDEKCTGINSNAPFHLGSGHLQIPQNPTMTAWAIDIGDVNVDNDFHSHIEDQLKKIIEALLQP
jgi:5-methylcytosine-specific restriction endonuclease McrBC regulatory subunit McrC